MGRWQPDALGRLQQAALELYGERGFEPTAVADIAERAGLTERTFFRYFADKREVLFSGGEALIEVFVKNVAAAPDSRAPLDVVGEALQAAGGFFAGRIHQSRARQAVIDANPSLQERELSKLATLGAAVAEALRARGVDDPAAVLAAEAGITVFKVSFDRWVNGPDDQEFSDVVRTTMEDFKAVARGS
ncbi:TetR family transcriptional regulator [Mycolicibacterium madagascariense]|uniref:TetR family transcriptional regulator n=1 Tax=Mycolicibacterium madagascariense TaxID=212765 RepID=A0A7I7X941_9MYCO|nr:TetR family transcriptional regulator [Mycolicibacterium madagascariense]MCV7011819.1 TetR family transcriptional regulator [Mycolicibacterium madagascariense]BBZ26329.1 TetR family transcriptional regulator [Mycolicibacterium madagascariense]